MIRDRLDRRHLLAQEWRQQVRPISPATVAAARGYIAHPVASESKATIC